MDKPCRIQCLWQGANSGAINRLAWKGTEIARTLLYSNIRYNQSGTLLTYEFCKNVNKRAVVTIVQAGTEVVEFMLSAGVKADGMSGEREGWR